MIHVLVAASSAVIRSVLKDIILKTKKLQWAGEAASYAELKAEIIHLNPDAVISDKSLFDAVRSSTLSDFCYTTVIPTIIYHQPGDKPYYSAKNIKFLEMPGFISFSSSKVEEYSVELEQYIMDLKCNVLFENHPASVVSSLSDNGASAPVVMQALPKVFKERRFKAVLVGVSTGGPGALLEFLKGIGKDFPIPIIITQHIDSFFDKNLITWLASEAALPIHLAENNMRPLPGHIYFAPSDVHVTFVPVTDDDYRIVLNHDAPINFLRPSVDKMFESAARVFGENCIAVVLTGMGADGAKECVHLKQLGAYTITQDKASSVIYGMPKAAYEMGGSCEVLPLKQIPERLWSLAGRERA